MFPFRHHSRKRGSHRHVLLPTPAAIVPTPALETSFNADPCCAVSILQIKDQLRQVLDRIDIVVRRRGDQTYARCSVTNL